MKKKKILIVSAVILLFLTIITAVSTIAVDGDTTTQPKIEKSGGVELESKRFPISRYQANNEASDEMLKGPFVGMTNVTFSFAGNIVRVVDAGMDIMYNLKPIDKFADSITNVSKTVYKSLKKNFGEALFIFVGGYVVYLFFVRGSAKDAMRRSILFIVVLVIGGLWVANSGYYMKAFNALSVELQGKLLKAGNGLIGIVENEGIYADALKIEKGKEMEGTVAVMRNVYFDIALKKPYLIVNYDQTSAAKINEKGDSKEELSRIDKLLSYKLSDEGQKEKQKYIEETEIKKYNNDTMTSGNVFNQLGESVIAVVSAIAIGIPFLALAFLSFLLQIIALAIVFFIPFAFIIAYVPQFAMSGFVALGRLLSVYLLKAMLSILILFVYVLCFMVDTLVPPNGFGMYLLNTVVLAAVMWIAIKKRDSIVQFVTAGKVVSVDNNMVDNMRKEYVQPSWEAAKKGAGRLSGAIGQIGKVFGNRKGKGGFEDQESPSSEGTSAGGNSPGMVTGFNKGAISRTPQQNEKPSVAPPSEERKALERKPQNMSKEQPRLTPSELQKKQQLNSSTRDWRREGVKAPMIDDVLKEEQEGAYKRAPMLQEKMDEKDRSDQRQFVENYDAASHETNGNLHQQEEENIKRAPLYQETMTEEERTDQQQFSEREHRAKGYDHQAAVQRENISPAYQEVQKETQYTPYSTVKQENKQPNQPVIRPSETPSKVRTDGFSMEKKQSVSSSGESRFVNREVPKKVTEKPLTLKRNSSKVVNKVETLPLHDIVGRSSEKGIDRLREDERT
ncbi:CD3337/EF1877 family mobilome membrane protein [Bacillus halotolerans]|uniref:CD3337/EF1877 family mobilome membrane protein n=1 Tax=Bacillus halotolerans TaxID=260554 RepID=UPI00403F153A